MTIEVRPARYEDLFGVVRCLILAREEIDIEIPEHEAPFAYHVIIHQIEAGLLFVGDKGEEIVGVVALSIHHWPWNRNHKLLVNEHFFVLPDHRPGGLALRLLDAAKRRAHELQMPLRIDLMGGGDRALKDRFMQQMGFKYLGGQFLYEGGDNG